MKFFMDNVLLIGLALGSGFMLLWPMLKRSAGGVANVSPNEAVLLINRSNAVVLDVRDDAEFAAGHVADAKHIPLAQLESRINELKRFQQKPLLVHCQSGVRSAKACDLLRKHGFEKLYNLQGGLNAWAQAKLPVIKD
ncbi:MAG TPA: rhodanese-like domain-containing protein [Methylophilaceae bacterium]|nr:rhodanese-like domain-containing protein [Methylophilaceae bacterium]